MKRVALLILLIWAVPLAGYDNPQSHLDPVSTFSIVAIDPETGDLGLAVASRYFAVGSVVPWAEAEVGIVATQANVNIAYGQRALLLLKQGLTADQVLDRLLEEDRHEGKDGRQVAIVDGQGNVVTFTGPGALTWAGHNQGSTWSAQGNILVGPEVVEAMGRAFEATRGELAERLYAALKAGDTAAGGDSRGRQSASLLVVGKGRGRNLNNDRYVDIRVDDHPRPMEELRRLLDLNLAYHYQYEVYRVLRTEQVAEAKQILDRSSSYCISSDTHLRQGFLSYLAGERSTARKEFLKAKDDPEFGTLWENLIRVRPAFRIVQQDAELLKELGRLPQVH